MEYWITYLGGNSLSVICMPAHQSPAIHWFFFLLLFFSFLPFLFRAAMAIGKVISIIAKFLQRAPSPIQSLQLKLLKKFEEKKRKKKKKERRLTPKQRKEIEGDSYFCTQLHSDANHYHHKNGRYNTYIRQWYRICISEKLKIRQTRNFYFNFLQRKPA